MSITDMLAFRTWRLIALGVGLLLFAALVVSEFHIAMERDVMRRTRIELLDRHAAIDGLRDALVDAEAAQRGYLLTGKTLHLAPYERAMALARSWAERLAALPRDAATGDRVATLIELAALKRQELERAMIEEASGRHAVALGIIDSERGIRDMEVIRALLFGLVEDLLARRPAIESHFDRINFWARVVTALLALVALGNGLVIGFAFDRLLDTERARRAEAERLSLDREAENARLAEARLVAEERAAAAQALATAKARFVASASHDLRQPLHAIRLHAAALRARVAADAAEIVGDIDRLCVSMHGALSRLLELARIDAGVVAPRLQKVALDEAMERLRPELAAHAARRGLELRLHVPPLAVRGDPVLVDGILRNLAGNALKYTKSGGVLIAARRRLGGVALEIWDTGPGIGAGDRARIFEPFQRVGGSGDGESFGLGLTIAQRHSALLGAELTLQSRPGHGSCFRVVFPEFSPEPLPGSSAGVRPAPVAAAAFAALPPARG